MIKMNCSSLSQCGKESILKKFTPTYVGETLRKQGEIGEAFVKNLLQNEGVLLRPQYSVKYQSGQLTLTGRLDFLAQWRGQEIIVEVKTTGLKKEGELPPLSRYIPQIAGYRLSEKPVMLIIVVVDENLSIVNHKSYLFNTSRIDFPLEYELVDITLLEETNKVIKEFEMGEIRKNLSHCENCWYKSLCTIVELNLAEINK